LEFTGPVTALFWLPQHTFPAWLGAAYLFDARPKSLLGIGMLIVLTLLWSPFVAIGLFIISGNLILRMLCEKSQRQIWWRQQVLPALLVLPVSAVFILYILSNKLDIPTVWIWNFKGFTWDRLPMFWALEFGVATYLTLKMAPATARERQWLWWIVVALLLIPLVRMGIYNDSCMRVSMPMCFMLWLILARKLVEALDGSYFTTAQRNWRPYVVAVWVMVLLSNWSEVQRSLDHESNAPRSIDEVGGILTLTPRPLVTQYLGDPEAYFFRYLAQDARMLGE